MPAVHNTVRSNTDDYKYVDSESAPAQMHLSVGGGVLSLVHVSLRVGGYIVTCGVIHLEVTPPLSIMRARIAGNAEGDLHPCVSTGRERTNS